MKRAYKESERRINVTHKLKKSPWGKGSRGGAELERGAIGGDEPKQTMCENTLMKPTGLYANF